MQDTNQGLRDDQIIVTLGIFSGRPNPAFNLDGEETEELARLIHGVVGKDPIHPPPHPKLGEFYGFRIIVPKDLAKTLDLSANLRLFNGVLTEGTGRQQRHWRALSDMEQLLTRHAFEKGFGEHLRTFGVEGPPPEPSAD